MNSFKLIGIRPHKDCGEKFLKVLEPGRLYQFYNEYVFYTEKGKFDGVNGEIAHYKFNKTVPEDLYKIGNLNVNISAVVGKNGTGKSSLIELLLYANYLIGINFRDKAKNRPFLPKYSDLLKIELDDKQETLNSWNETIKKYHLYISDHIKRISKSQVRLNFFEKSIFGHINEIKFLSAEVTSLENHVHHLKAESILSDEDNVNPNRAFRCSLFFVLNNCVYEMSFDHEIELFQITTNNRVKVEDIELKKHFFYSTILNYSHHSLNANHVGFWINSLFHKNDGYKTPAVINPMRHEGNFDINKEIELSKSRLLVNSLINQLNDLNENVPISDKQFIESIQIKRKDNSTYKRSVSLKLDVSNSIFKISGHPVGVNTIEEILNTNELNDIVTLGYQGEFAEIVQDLMNYLVNKVHRIQKNYSEYFDKAMSIGIEDADQIVDDRNTIEKLNQDFSHVSFKYHRSIYYLQKIISGKFDNLFKDIKNGTIVTLKDYLENIDFINIDPNGNQNDVSNIFLRVPPPIFEVDFNIASSQNTNSKRSTFEELSSGEQQSIHNINTLIYHLNNTFSVHRASVGSRQKYHYFNAVFDEIELYFHPDFQRKFIDDLLNTLRKHKHLSENPFITGMNVVFSTHSPFILSDIPEQNILKLEYNEFKKHSIPKMTERQTFGANIHDLLANSFFLQNGSMGEYAKNYVETIYKTIEANEINENSSASLYKKIDLIGEDIIKERLEFILNQKLQKPTKDEIIEDLKNEINRLRNEKN